MMATGKSSIGSGEQSMGWKIANFLMVIISTIATGVGSGVLVKMFKLEGAVVEMKQEVALLKQFTHKLPPMEWRERVIKLEILHQISHKHAHSDRNNHHDPINGIKLNKLN